MNRYEREREDAELLKLVGQLATRENIRKLKHGGSTGADGTIKSVVTRTEMEQQRYLCPRYRYKVYVALGGGVATGYFVVSNVIGIAISGFSHMNMLFLSAGAIVAGIWTVFIYDTLMSGRKNAKKQ